MIKYENTHKLWKALRAFFHRLVARRSSRHQHTAAYVRVSTLEQARPDGGRAS